MKLVYKCMTIFFNFQTTSSHLHSLQVENCGSNSRLVVDEDDNGKFRPERVKALKYFQVNYGDQRVFSCTYIQAQKIFQGKLHALIFEYVMILAKLSQHICEIN